MPSTVRGETSQIWRCGNEAKSQLRFQVVDVARGWEKNEVDSGGGVGRDLLYVLKAEGLGAKGAAWHLIARHPRSASDVARRETGRETWKVPFHSSLLGRSMQIPL